MCVCMYADILLCLLPPSSCYPCHYSILSSLSPHSLYILILTLLCSPLLSYCIFATVIFLSPFPSLSSPSPLPLPSPAGAHDDARMNVAIALTAAKEGAAVANHVEVLSLIKAPVSDKEGARQVVRGARVRDTLTQKEWDVRAKVVVNATGPFTDLIRHMDDPGQPSICSPSAGIHISLPSYYR